MQMAAIFSLDSNVWLMNYVVWLHKCYQLLLCDNSCIICKIKEQFHPSYQSIVCFTHLLFYSIYIDKTIVALNQHDLYTKTKTLSAGFFSSICLDILRHSKETIPLLHTLLVFYCAVIVFMSINESFVTHSQCIQF